MSAIKKAIMENVLKTHAIHDEVLRYTDESTKNKLEHLLTTLNKLSVL